MIRCDNEKEYLNNRFYKFIREKSIILNNCQVVRAPACVVVANIMLSTQVFLMYFDLQNPNFLGA